MNHTNHSPCLSNDVAYCINVTVKKMEKFLSCTQEKPHDVTYAQKSKWVLQSIVS